MREEMGKDVLGEPGGSEPSAADAETRLSALNYRLRLQAEEWDNQYGVCGEVPDAACQVRTILDRYMGEPPRVPAPFLAWEDALAKPGGELYAKLKDWFEEPLNRTDATSAADTAASAVLRFLHTKCEPDGAAFGRGDVA